MFTTIAQNVNATQQRQTSTEDPVIAVRKVAQAASNKTSKPRRSFTAVLLKALSCFVA